MKDKAIIFTVYNREDYFRATLNEWSKVRNLDKYDIYFKIERTVQLGSMLKIIYDFSATTNAEINIIENNGILGCARNTWTALDEMFAKYNFVILAEDDIHPSQDVADYFDYLEEKYRDDQEIITIGTNYEGGNFEDDVVMRIPKFRVQLWGTWKDRWEKYIKPTWDFDYSTGVNNGPAGWDWNLTLRVIPHNNLKSIVPYSPRSQHMGVEGIHCNSDIFESTQYKSFRDDHTWEEIKEI